MNYENLFDSRQLIVLEKKYQSFRNETERAAFAMEKFSIHHREMIKIMENMLNKSSKIKEN